MNNQRLLTGVLWVGMLCGVENLGAQEAGVYSLQQLFDIAESHSVFLQPSLTAESLADKEISVAKSERLPNVSAGLSVSYIGDGFTTKRDFSDYQKAPIPHFGNGLSLSVEQPLYTGGAITDGIELARMKSTASRFATELERNNIRFNIVGYYLDIYRQLNMRKVVVENLSLAQKELEEMKARYNQGIVLLNDITRYELLCSNLELQLIKVDNTINILQRNLSGTVGLPEETKILPDTTMIDHLLPVADESWWQEKAIAESPTLRLATTEVDINKRIEHLDKSARLPKIGIQAGWSIDGPILVEVPPINRNLSYWYVGLGVKYDLSSLYKNNKTEARNRMATQQAQQKLDAARESLEMNIRADYIRSQESFEELRTRTKSVELAERNYHTVSVRYSSDMALITDLIDAANSKLDAEQMLVNAKINTLYYYYKLQFLSGTISH